MNKIFKECHHCRHRLKRLLDKCGKMEAWDGYRCRYKTIYVLFMNSAGIIRHLHMSDHKVYRYPQCPLFHDPRSYIFGEEPTELQSIRQPGSTTLLTKADLRRQLVETILTKFYKGKTGRGVLEIIDVTNCLTAKEKYMFRQDVKFNSHSDPVKRVLFPTLWWFKYYDKAKVLWHYDKAILKQKHLG